jgi:hypothetical protein
VVGGQYLGLNDRLQHLQPRSLSQTEQFHYALHVLKMNIDQFLDLLKLSYQISGFGFLQVIVDLLYSLLDILLVKERFLDRVEVGLDTRWKVLKHS